MRFGLCLLPITATLLGATLAQADGYTLRWSSDGYDGVSHYSETRKVDVSYARRAHISGLTLRLLGGAKTVDTPEFSLGIPEDPQPPAARSIAMAYDSRKNVLVGDAPDTLWFNAFVRPTLSPGLPSKTDTRWSRNFQLSDLALGFRSRGGLQFDFERIFRTHEGEDYALMSYTFQPVTYRSAAGTNIMHWGRGFIIMDADFTEIFYSGAWHRGVSNAGTADERMYASRSGMMNILDSGRVKLDLSSFDAAASLVRDSVMGYERLDTAPLNRLDDTRQEFDRSFMIVASAIDLWAGAHVEDSVNQFSLIKNLLGSGNTPPSDTRTEANQAITATQDSALGSSSSTAATINKLLGPLDVLTKQKISQFQSTADDLFAEAAKIGREALATTDPNARRALQQEAKNLLNRGTRLQETIRNTNSLKDELIRAVVDGGGDSSKGLVRLGVEGAGQFLEVLGDIDDVLTVGQALTNSDPNNLVGSQSTSFLAQAFDRVFLDVVVSLGPAIAKRDAKGIVLGASSSVTKSISDIMISGAGALNAQDEAALAQAGLDQTQIAFVDKILKARADGVDLTDRRNVQRVIDELEPRAAERLRKGLEDLEQNDPPVGGGGGGGDDTGRGTLVITDPPVGGGGDDTGGGTQIQTDPPVGNDTGGGTPGDDGADTTRTGTVTTSTSDTRTTSGGNDDGGTTRDTTTLPPFQRPEGTTGGNDGGNRPARERRTAEFKLPEIDYPLAPPRKPKPVETDDSFLGQTSELPQEILDQIEREIELEERRQELAEIQDRLLDERDERQRRQREERDARNRDVVDVFGDFIENNAFTFEDMVGIVPTDLSPYADWLATQDLRRLERLAVNANYPNLASALADYVNLIKQASDQGFRQYALGSYQGAGLAGFLPSIASRNAARAQLALGDILINSGFIQSLGGLTDITISGTRLSITLFDFGVEDGDVVTLFVNQLNRQVLSTNFTLSNAGTTVQANLQRSIPAAVTITAQNEGLFPPNTAGVSLSPVISGNSSQGFSLGTGESAILRVQPGR